ncbi:Endoplasmic reticulum-Golgi intermediate compartment protein 3 [Rhizoclosmatium sp. JEL0117]|nr:Endoplasmic reticulum-Golgi intermediate compartment protein 3 [Rhizoclosmatium sp. JEL0117]
MSTLHQRKKYSTSDSISSEEPSLFQSLKSLDSYAKPLEDFTTKTNTGALISLISYFIIFLLLLSEFTDWRTMQVNPSLDVDIARKEKMEINLNITFPKIPCFMLSIDVMDVSGEHQNDVDHSMMKGRLTPDGKHIEATKGVIGEKKDETAVADPNYCGNCYGGVKPANGCCNTCEDVRKAYTERGWSFDKPESIEQCVKEGWSEMMKEQENEGCNMSGHIEVNKVAGNFHFAPGKSFQQGGMHVHDLAAFGRAGANYDFTHVIHSLNFGPVGTGLKNPLDDHSKKANKGHYMYQYFIKVVSTKYEYLNGTALNTNQIAVTEHERDLGMPGGGLPGVFFNFDISPMLVTYKEYKKPFSHFLTDVCAVVGGVFTVGGIIDSLIYTAEKRIKRKVDLGKQG